jgi:hypothetical protein
MSTPLPPTSLSFCSLANLQLFPKSAYQDKNGKNIFPGWAIQFQYKNKDRDGNPIPGGIKVAYLWPRNGKTEIYNPVFQKDGKVLWFMLINPQDGTGYVSTVFRVFNPQNPQNPQNGDDQLLIFGTIGSFMNREEREIDKYHTYNNYEDQVKNGTDRPLVLAQEGGYYRAIRNEPSLDSLLGMEGNDVGQVPYEGYKDWGNYHYFDIFAEGFSGVEKSSIRIYERPIEDIDKNGNKFYIPLDPQFEKVCSDKPLKNSIRQLANKTETKTSKPLKLPKILAILNLCGYFLKFSLSYWSCISYQSYLYQISCGCSQPPGGGGGGGGGNTTYLSLQLLDPNLNIITPPVRLYCPPTPTPSPYRSPTPTPTIRCYGHITPGPTNIIVTTCPTYPPPTYGPQPPPGNYACFYQHTSLCKVRCDTTPCISVACEQDVSYANFKGVPANQGASMFDLYLPSLASHLVQ